MIWESNAVTFSLKVYTARTKGCCWSETNTGEAEPTLMTWPRRLSVKDLVTTGLSCASGAAEGAFSPQL